MKNKAMKICNETIYPGESLSLALPLPELHSCAPYFMPIKVIHGKTAGPTLIVTAALHGDELNGTEIINRLLTSSTLNKLRGTIIAVPVVNVYGLSNRSRYLQGGIDLNECFPGKKNGTHAERVAHVFYSEIFSLADYAIDLQTGPLNCSNLPQVILNKNDEETRALANAFAAPVIINKELEQYSLSAVARDNNVPMLTYEAGEAMRFDEHAIKFGVRGIMRVMRKLNMLPAKQTKVAKHHKSFIARKEMWLRASTSGIGITKLKLGQYINEGDTVATIKDPFGCSDPVYLASPVEGVVVGINNLSLVHEGEGLVQVAFFPEMESVATHLESWEEKSEAHLNKQIND